MKSAKILIEIEANLEHSGNGLGTLKFYCM